MNKDNSKVPVAILSCFLIAFILQGALKLSGVFIFEKALNWEIFYLIDRYKITQVIYYSFLMSMTTYCLSFALTNKPYSNKWYHYVIIVGASICVTTLRMYVTLTYQINILVDVFIYVLVPLSITLTTSIKNRLFRNNIFEIILAISIHIILYFCYLGLGYWITLLTSILPLDTMWLTSSLMFLTQLEIYIGTAMIMLSMNCLIKFIKEVIVMRMPLDIASEEAMKKELEAKKAKKQTKKSGK